MKIHRRYHITPFLEEQDQYLKIDSPDDPFPDYFEKDLENFEKALNQQLCSEVQDRRKNPLVMRVSRILKFHNVFSSGNNIKYTL